MLNLRAERLYLQDPATGENHYHTQITFPSLIPPLLPHSPHCFEQQLRLQTQTEFGGKASQARCFGAPMNLRTISRETGWQMLIMARNSSYLSIQNSTQLYNPIEKTSNHLQLVNGCNTWVCERYNRKGLTSHSLLKWPFGLVLRCRHSMLRYTQMIKCIPRPSKYLGKRDVSIILVPLLIFMRTWRV